MQSRSRVITIAVLAAASAACNSGRHSASAFHLPPDGDAQRGRAAFVDLGCNSCHEVSGVDLPRPTSQKIAPLVLGGTVDSKLSDAYLVTSIIYPSYELAPFPKEQITVGGHSRMPSYSDRISVRQVTDIVAFLQSHYLVVRIPEAIR